jgi:hypothetical protein
VNGAVREGVLIPRAGTTLAHAISTVTLCSLILLLSWATIGWIRPMTSMDAWTIGGLWLVMTPAFEFLAGHYLFGNPWSRLFEDYNVLNGRIWILVLLTTVIAPRITMFTAVLSLR